MEELVKVFLYRGKDRMDGMEIRRDEFERVLDELFAQDQDELDIVIGETDIRGITDIVLSAQSARDFEAASERQTVEADTITKKAA